MIQFTLRPSNITNAGTGLFAEDYFEPGDILGEYKGTLVSHGSEYAFEYEYVVDNKTTTVQIEPHESCVFRFINDTVDIAKCEFNEDEFLVSRYLTPDHNVDWLVRHNKVYIKAVAHIEPGDELYIDYGDEYWGYSLIQKTSTSNY